jgi:hypothetical protein
MPTPRLITRIIKGSIFVAALAALIAIAPVSAYAANGDCSQPASTGDNPTASDCLFILRVAVGTQACTPQDCVCDPSGDGNTTASDALRCLQRAVGQPVTLNCPPPCGEGGTTTTTIPTNGCTNPLGCPGPKNTCTSAEFISVIGSDLDTGWNGLAHNQDIVEGASVTLEVVRRCVDDENTICKIDADCPSGECRPFCDCDDPGNATCQITGPTVQPRCTNDLVACTTNADCAAGTCERFFGPPLPLSAANTPACVTTFFAEDLVGTANAATGTGEAAAFLRSRVHLGVANDRPCPRCGAPGANPEVGDQFTCEGGPRNGSACTVDAVSPVFGGVSAACPPAITSNISGEGLAIRFLRVTTGTTEQQATLQCGGALGDVHPNGSNPLCIDDFSPCSSNADCTRCTNDRSACASNADCTGGGTCAAAPDQPISCGFYCHCGFCNDDPAKPCFNDGECDAGETCNTGNSTTGTQDQPNACADLACGGVDDERCCADGDPACSEPTPLEGSCSIKTFISCSGNPGDERFGACERESAGTCVLEKRACFEHQIGRTGIPSPLGSNCVDDPDVGACTTNADCGVGACVDDTSEPTTVALFCVPKTASGAINAAGGIPGPGAITFKSVVISCRCGDGTVGCDEECDDGNNASGDGCDEICRDE